MSILGRISFQKALTLIALVPLLAVTGLGGAAGYNSYLEYQKLTRAAALAELAYQGGELMMIMPLETAPNRMEIRKQSDAIYQAMMDQMAELDRMGYGDPITLQLRANLEKMYARMPEYRQKIDAGDKDPILPLRYAQPVAAAGLDLTLRTASLTEDLTLSSDIRAHHALMKVNEAYLGLNRMGQFYIENGAFGKAELVLRERTRQRQPGRTVAGRGPQRALADAPVRVPQAIGVVTHLRREAACPQRHRTRHRRRRPCRTSPHHSRAMTMQSMTAQR